VLIVTKSDDNESVARVSAALKRRGHLPLRLDTDLYPELIRTATRIERDGTATRFINEHDLRDVKAVWYRRYLAGGSLPTTLGDLRAPAVDESRRALYGLIAALPCKKLDALEDVRRCDHKELQIIRARHHGLDVPRTLFTNDPDSVRSFFDDCNGRVITKMQSSFAVHRNGQEHVVFTNVVEKHHLADLDGLRFCPMMFQEQIDKRLEIRATVVGDRVYAASIDSKHLVDWRQEGLALINKWKRYALPRDVEKALLALVHEIGLRYGACDLILTPEGKHIFLEVNAGGEWLWLDDLLGIADAIAEELTTS
jgi:hypothetical protein